MRCIYQHQTNHNRKSTCVCMYHYVWVCVCAACMHTREREKEKERDRDRDREREHNKYVLYTALIHPFTAHTQQTDPCTPYCNVNFKNHLRETLCTIGQFNKNSKMQHGLTTFHTSQKCTQIILCRGCRSTNIQGMSRDISTKI